MKAHVDLEFSRRALLRAAGATLLVPGFLKRAFAETAVGRPSLVLMMQTNGTHQPSFWPTAGSFDSPILHDLLTDAAVGPRTTLVSGVNLNKQGSPVGNGHDWGWHGLYSGVDNISMGAPFGGGPSVDQILVKKLVPTTPFKNIHCGVEAADYPIINAGRASFVCAAPGLQVPCELDIYGLYAKIFGSLTDASASTTGSQAAAIRRLTQRLSVLDAAASDLVALEARLGPAQRAKVDIHLTAIRDFETRLSASLRAAGAGTQAGACSSFAPSTRGIPSTGQGNEANCDVLNHLFMEFIANVVACNMVGVLTFQFGRGGEHFHYGWLNDPQMRPDFHNDIAHQDSGSDAAAANVMVHVAQYHAGLLLELGRRLASFPAGGGATALDNALVVWGNELATGTHGLEDYPIVFVGGAAGQLKKTGYVVSAGAQIHQRLGCTILNIMGIPASGFGWVADAGPLRGLELASLS